MNRLQRQFVVSSYIPGTIFSPKPNEDYEGNTIVPNPGPTHDPDEAQLFRVAITRDKAQELNEGLAANYLNRFTRSWLVNYQAGKLKGPAGWGDPDAPPPVPDAMVVVVVMNDRGDLDIQPSGKEAVVNEQTGEVIEYGTGPYVSVCSIPSYTKIPAPKPARIVS